jgi:predicted Rossmann fold flavoprotein
MAHPAPARAPRRFDVVALGAGAAGLMAAIECGKRGRRVLLVDHAPEPGRKIIISGGGRCNFTNIDAAPENFLSANPRFCVSALKRYSARDFLALVEKHGVPWHEKKLGQLFCDRSARDILALLLDEASRAGVELLTRCEVTGVERIADAPSPDSPEAAPTSPRYRLATANHGAFECASLIVATGGLSLPKIGATDFGHRLARQFGLKIVETMPGLVPLLLGDQDRSDFKGLPGVSVDAFVAPASGKPRFRENILFTHKGLSGPAILQASSYWRHGQAIRLDLFPAGDLFDALRAKRSERPKAELRTILSELLPSRFAQRACESRLADIQGPMAGLSDAKLRAAAAFFQRLELTPVGTEGYRTAEVTLGGVDTDELSSKTMESKKAPGLFFIGEVVDVTGWLGGYNFQWAWSSGWCAGQWG